MTNELDNNFQESQTEAPLNNATSNPFKPENIPYDGSNVISSHKMNNFTELATNSNNEETENISSDDGKEPKNNNKYTTEEIEKLITQNELLQNKMTSYNKMVEHFLEAKTQQTPKVSTDAKPEQDQKTHQMDSQTKQEVVQEILKEINRQSEMVKVLDNFRTQNPDLANDPQKEYLIGLMAGQHYDSGMNFNDAIGKAIEDFRKITGQANNNTLPNKENGNISNHNIPQKRPQTTPNNSYIEGSSPSLPEKQFKASELINMQINKPDEYLRLQPQIMAAYRNGRVLFD